MLNENFVYVGIAINVIGFASYFVDTIKGKIKPNKVSFFLWSLAPLIAFFAQIKEGVGVQSLMTLTIGLIPICIFLGSFVNKKAYWKITRFDLSCGALSFVGLILWQITDIANIAIFFGMLADGIAYIPTIAKSYKFPETEIGWFWLTGSLNGLFTLLTVTTWNFANFGFPIYLFVINTIVFIIIQFKIGKRE